MEQVILVNELDEPIGLMEKIEAHEKALLHRAFSVFVFKGFNPNFFPGLAQRVFKPNVRQPGSQGRVLHQGLRALQEPDVRTGQEARRGPREGLRRLPRHRVHLQAPSNFRIPHSEKSHCTSWVLHVFDYSSSNRGTSRVVS